MWNASTILWWIQESTHISGQRKKGPPRLALVISPTVSPTATVSSSYDQPCQWSAPPRTYQTPVLLCLEHPWRSHPQPTLNCSLLLEQESSPRFYNPVQSTLWTMCFLETGPCLTCLVVTDTKLIISVVFWILLLQCIFPWMKDGRTLLSLAEVGHFTDFYQMLAAHPSQASNPWPLTHIRLSSHQITLQLF